MKIKIIRIVMIHFKCIQLSKREIKTVEVAFLVRHWVLNFDSFTFSISDRFSNSERLNTARGGAEDALVVRLKGKKYFNIQSFKGFHGCKINPLKPFRSTEVRN